MIQYQTCPSCDHAAIAPLFSVQDHSVSNQDFELWSCKNCGLRFTQNVPAGHEIGSYYASEDYVSHSNTGTGLINTLYHGVRKITVGTKKKMIEKASGKKAGRILDIGSGTGTFLHTMQKAGWQVTGIEPSPVACEKARELYGLQFLPPEQLYTFEPGSFDVITLWHVLEHVHDIDAYLSTLRGLLVPGGKLFIAVPNFTSFDAAYYKKYWAAYDVPRHLYHFSPLSMKLLLQKHSFRIVGRRPMWFDSFYVSMLSEKYRKRLLAPVQGAFIGLVSNLNALFAPSKASSIVYIAT